MIGWSQICIKSWTFGMMTYDMYNTNSWWDHYTQLTSISWYRWYHDPKLEVTIKTMSALERLGVGMRIPTLRRAIRAVPSRPLGIRTSHLPVVSCEKGPGEWGEWGWGPDVPGDIPEPLGVGFVCLWGMGWSNLWTAGVPPFMEKLHITPFRMIWILELNGRCT